jgi:hypothetical protein
LRKPNGKTGPKTSNLKRHLLDEHASLLTLGMRLIILVSIIARFKANLSCIVAPQPGIMASFGSRLKTPILALPTEPDSALVDLIDTALLPYNIVSSPSFNNFIKVIQAHPKWKAPHRAYISSQLQPEAHQRLMTQLSHFVESCGKVAITTDGWSGPQMRSFWSITIHGIDNDFQFQSLVGGCVPVYNRHTASEIAAKLKPTLTTLKITDANLSAIVTDEGGAAPCVVDHFESAISIHCAAHLLQTVQRNAFAAVEVKHPTLTIIYGVSTSIISSYRQSTVTRQQITHLQLENGEKVRQLLPIAPTRFNSCFHSFQSMLDAKDSITQWLTQADHHKITPQMQYVMMNLKSFWTTLQEVVNVLDGFEVASRIFQLDQEPTLHRVIPEYLCLQSTLAQLTQDLTVDCSKELAAELAIHLEKKFTPFCDFELIAFCLDPDNRSIESPESLEFFQAGDNLLHERIPAVVVVAPPVDSAPTATSPSGRYRSNFFKTRAPTRTTQDEVSSFIAQSASGREQLSLLGYWKSVAGKWPKLAELAREVLGVPASQSTSERQFSIMRSIYTHLRTSLKPEKADMVLTCAANNRARDLAIQTSSRRARSALNIQADAAREAAREETRKAAARSTLGNYFEMLSSDNSHDSGEEWILTNIEDIEDIEETGERSDDEDYEFPDPELPRKSAKTSESSTPHSNDSPKFNYSCSLAAPGDGDKLIGILSSPINPPPAWDRIFGSATEYFTNFAWDPKDGAKMSFTFTMSAKGKRTFRMGRRSALFAVGELLTFE